MLRRHSDDHREGMRVRAYDAIVIGGGLVGSAVALGLRQAGLSVAILDEGDVAFRASRGNFGLVWVQSKGDGMPDYAEWTRTSADLWPDFADSLSGELGIDIAYRKPGGLHLCLTEQELEEHKSLIQRMHNQAAPNGYDCRIVDLEELREMIPGLGDRVVGGSYCPHDGHVNPLYLLRGLHKALHDRKADYFANHRIRSIERSGAHFVITLPEDRFACSKVVLAAGLGSRELAEQVGLDIPISPVRGQILVTERTRPFLVYPTAFVRQTEEGTFLLGDSHEDVGFDTGTTVNVTGDIAVRTLRSFPILKDLQVVRTWGALRIMTPDGFPIYEESAAHPGAYAVTCHSGVTLAAAHALRLAPAIANGSFSERYAAFSAQRFHVQAH